MGIVEGCPERTEEPEEGMPCLDVSFPKGEGVALAWLGQLWLHRAIGEERAMLNGDTMHLRGDPFGTRPAGHMEMRLSPLSASEGAQSQPSAPHSRTAGGPTR